MLDFLAKGGPVLIVLIGASTVSLALALERFVYLRKTSQEVSRLLQSLKTEAANDISSVLNLITSDVGPAVVLESVLQALQSGGEDAAKAIDKSLQRAAFRLEKHLDIIALTANLAPLLGLMGTVTGMIDTFTIFSQQGTRQPLLLARGIAEALITTAAGLAIAIINTAVHHYLSKRVDSILIQIEEHCTEVVNALAERGHSRVSKTAS